MSTSNNESVGQRLKRLRESHGWTQEELAKKLGENGTDPQNILRWEHDFSLPRPYYRRMLSDIFDLSIDDLFMPQKDDEEEKIVVSQDDQEIDSEKPKHTTIDGIPVIGREKDIQNVLDILRDKNNRLLVLVGLPGVGKTELARQVEKEAETSKLFNYVSPLAIPQEVTNPDAVIKLLTDTLKDIPKQDGMLVIINNCEQVNNIAQALDRFLEEHKYITILATSRTRLNRNDYPVEQLKAPKTIFEPIQTLQTNDSVKLFLASVNISRRDMDNLFEITEDNVEKIAHLCIVFGGLPLMLCMAGSWIDELGIDEVYNTLLSGKIQRLKYTYYKDDRQVSKDQISIEEVVRWSYGQLEPDAKKLFRRLGLFVSGCTKGVAATVCNLGDLPTDDPNFTNIILTLRKHHLVTYQDEDRRINIAHNILREFGLNIFEDEEGYIKEDTYIENFIKCYYSMITDFVLLKYVHDKDDKELEEFYNFFKHDKLNIIMTYWLVHELLKLRKKSLIDMAYETTKVPPAIVALFYRICIEIMPYLIFLPLRFHKFIIYKYSLYWIQYRLEQAGGDYIKVVKQMGETFEELKDQDSFILQFFIWNIFLKDTLAWTEEEIILLRTIAPNFSSSLLF